MKYYFSAVNATTPVFKQFLKDKPEKIHYLLSFASKSVEEWKDYYQDGRGGMMIDSGAFTAWNSGKKIDREAYLKFIQHLPEDVIKINLDVIPETGSTMKQKLKCAEQGFKNYIYLSKRVKNVIPVHHYGEGIEWAKVFLDHTDYICISPANDTTESVKRAYLKFIFKELGTKVRTHTLGYSSVDGMELFPFYSLDSISYKQTVLYGHVLYTRTDGKAISIPLSEYAKHHGFQYNKKKSMFGEENLAVTDAALQESANTILATAARPTKSFEWMHNQLNLL